MSLAAASRLESDRREPEDPVRLLGHHPRCTTRYPWPGPGPGDATPGRARQLRQCARPVRDTCDGSLMHGVSAATDQTARCADMDRRISWFTTTGPRVLLADGWWPLRHGSAEARSSVGKLLHAQIFAGHVVHALDRRHHPGDRGRLHESTRSRLRANLTSLLQVPGANTIRGMLIGRFSAPVA